MITHIDVGIKPILSLMRILLEANLLQSILRWPKLCAVEVSTIEVRDLLDGSD